MFETDVGRTSKDGCITKRQSGRVWLMVALGMEPGTGGKDRNVECYYLL